MSKRITCPLAVICSLAFLWTAGCSTGQSTPTGPSQTVTTPAPAPASATGSVEITVNPNPVPFSGQPISDAAGCAGSKNTWFYEQILRETGGAAVTFTSRIDKFDERVVNNTTGISLLVPANGSLTVPTRWCSSQGVAHTAQSTFSGTDAGGRTVNAGGAVANLRSP